MVRTFVVCLIENDKKEMLLQKKTLDYPDFPGIWSLFGGEAESENLYKEMNRELKEEIGIKLNFNFIFDENFVLNNEKTKAHIFLAKLNDLSKIRIGEGAGVAFFEKKELNKLNFRPDDEFILNRYFKEF